MDRKAEFSRYMIAIANGCGIVEENISSEAKQKIIEHGHWAYCRHAYPTVDSGRKANILSHWQKAGTLKLAKATTNRPSAGALVSISMRR